MYAIFGKSYIVAAELYLGGSSFVFRYSYIAFFLIVHYFLERFYIGKPGKDSVKVTEKNAKKDK
jgi:hypothetical protein